jgi:hypothetical protein
MTRRSHGSAAAAPPPPERRDYSIAASLALRLRSLLLDNAFARCIGCLGHHCRGACTSVGFVVSSCRRVVTSCAERLSLMGGRLRRTIRSDQQDLAASTLHVPESTSTRRQSHQGTTAVALAARWALGCRETSSTRRPLSAVGESAFNLPPPRQIPCPASDRLNIRSTARSTLDLQCPVSRCWARLYSREVRD